MARYNLPPKKTSSLSSASVPKKGRSTSGTHAASGSTRRSASRPGASRASQQGAQRTQARREADRRRRQAPVEPTPFDMVWDRVDDWISKLPISRRAFTTGALVAGGTLAVAASVAPLSACTASEDVATEPTVVDSTAATSITDAFEFVEEPPLTVTAEYDLPLGTVLHPAEGTWLPATSTAVTSLPTPSACALSLETGQLATVVDVPQSGGNNTVIYAVRCSDQVYAWVEYDTVSQAWALFAAPFSGGAVTGSVTKLWEADANWDVPPFVVTGTEVIWLVMPTASGNASSERSVCYLWNLGDASATAVLSSPGRFATEPTVSEGVVTLTPRVREDDGVYYGLTAYRLSDGLSNPIDTLTLPAGVKPFSAVYMDGRFVFQIEASYSSGGLLGQMGTYVQTGQDTFVELSREPAAAASGSGSYLVVKSKASYVVADLENETYSVLTAVNRAVDYGEYPARVGTNDVFVTYTTVKEPTSGSPSQVHVRVMTYGAPATSDDSSDNTSANGSSSTSLTGDGTANSVAV